MDQSAVEVVPADKEDGEDEQAAAEEQARRDQDPFFFCRWISERPGLWFGKDHKMCVLKVLYSGIKSNRKIQTLLHL